MTRPTVYYAKFHTDLLKKNAVNDLQLKIVPNKLTVLIPDF